MESRKGSDPSYSITEQSPDPTRSFSLLISFLSPVASSPPVDADLYSCASGSQDAVSTRRRCFLSRLQATNMHTGIADSSSATSSIGSSLNALHTTNDDPSKVYYITTSPYALLSMSLVLLIK